MNEPMTVEEASLTPSPSDNFTDAQHKKQDKDVNAVIDTFSTLFTEEQQLSDEACAMLLQYIVWHSEGKLQVINGQKAIELMREKPKLKSALQKAWKTKDYKEIRKSGELRALPPPMDEPMPVEEASLTPSSSDNFTDAQHKKQDKDVTRDASKLFAEKKELSDEACAMLLQYIVLHSEGKLQVISGPEAIELMRENPKLKPALQEAWNTKDYKEIRKSELLTNPKPGKDEPVEQKKG